MQQDMRVYFLLTTKLIGAICRKRLSALEYLTEIYGGEGVASAEPGGKLGSLISHYRNVPASECQSYLEDYNANALNSLADINNKVRVYAGWSQNPAQVLIDAAQKLKDINANLRIYCVPLY